MKYDFSIIILYYNKEYEINLLLKAFTLQKYDKNKFELIIIDDGSKKRIDSIINKYSNIINISYHYMKHSAQRGINRNKGASFAKADRLIFLDSDVIPGKDLLYNFDLATKDDEKIISLGKRNDLLEFDTSYLDDDTIEHNFELLENLPTSNDIRTVSINFTKETGLSWNGNWQLLYSHCFCIWKSAFDKIGGFDKNFIYWGAEDIEFGYRLFKAGYKILINENTISYHLYHESNFLSKIKLLKKNYEIFIKKHQNWEIELFIRESECWPIQTIIFQEEIKKRKHLVTNLCNTDEIVNALPPKTLLAGIDIESIINCQKVEAVFNPESNIISNKIFNIMGLFSDYKKNHFELAIISEEYKEINKAVFTLILEKISFISKRIISIHNNDENVLDKIKNINRKKYIKEKFITFTLENDINRTLNRYWFLNLAIAADKIGLVTGVELGYDPWKKVNINNGFLYFSNHNKINILKKIYNVRNNFIGDLIPCIMDSEVVPFSSRSLGQRIFWEELGYINQEKYLKQKKLCTYNKMLLKRKWEKDIYTTKHKKEFLPVGIDLEKINDISSKKIEKNNKFTFLWAESFSSPFTNMDLVLSVFTELFNGNNDVELKVIVPANFRYNYKNEYNTDLLTKMQDNSIEHFKIFHNLFLEKLVKEYNFIKNIIFLRDDYSDEYCSNELYKSDCFIEVCSSRYMHPLVLESVAFGKKIITIDDNRYEDYLPDHSCYKVKYEKKSALFGFGHIEEPIITNINFKRYFLITKPKKESLINAFLSAYKDGKNDLIDTGYIKEFKEQYNWISIAEKLRSIIY